MEQMTDSALSLFPYYTFFALVFGGFIGGVAVFVLLKPRRRLREIEELRRELSQSVTHDVLKERFVSREQYEEVRTILTKSLDEKVSELAMLNRNVAELSELAGSRIEVDQVEKQYVPRTAFDELKSELRVTQDGLRERVDQNTVLTARLSAIEAERDSLLEQNSRLRSETSELITASRDTFLTLAQEIFNEKSKQFVDTNRSELQTLLQPLREHLYEFREKVEATRREEIQDITSLKEQIGTLHQSSARLSEEANQLARALKGGSKMQGDWGEERLRQILESEGLERFIDFEEQATYRTVEGNLLKPDVVLKMPQNRSIIIDAKVSLRSYSELVDAEPGAERDRLIRDHIQAIQNHINSLGSKEYHKAVGISSFEYVLLFTPIEGALITAFREVPDLFHRALKQHVLLVSPSTLLIALKIIRILWQREEQARNVEQVVKECDQLYTKFIDMLKALEGLEKGIEMAHREFLSVKTRLCSDIKRGGSIVGRIERIRSLGVVQTVKDIPSGFKEWVESEEDSISEVDGFKS
jgi:DNA recombination protein RmuC